MAKRVEPEVEFSGLLLKGIEHAFCENAMALRFSVQLKRTEWEKLCELSEVLGKDVEMVLRNIVKSGINKWYEELCESKEEEPKKEVTNTRRITEEEVLNAIAKKEGLTVDELVTKLNAENLRGTLYKILESLRKKGKIRFGKPTDPYRPYWSQTIYLKKD